MPLALKIAPDLNREQVEQLAQTMLNHHIDAVVATNTTTSREALVDALDAQQVTENKRHDYLLEAGGLSGQPLFAQATQIITSLQDYLAGIIPIIGLGGILSGHDAVKKHQAGAQLLQVYSGFIYRGPELVSEVIEALRAG